MKCDRPLKVLLQPVLVPVEDPTRALILRRQIAAWIDEVLQNYYAAQQLPDRGIEKSGRDGE